MLRITLSGQRPSPEHGGQRAIHQISQSKSNERLNRAADRVGRPVHKAWRKY